MINVEVLEVTDDNFMEIIKDPRVYVVEASPFDDERFRFNRIAQCEIGDLVTPGKVAVIKVTKVES